MRKYSSVIFAVYCAILIFHTTVLFGQNSQSSLGRVSGEMSTQQKKILLDMVAYMKGNTATAGLEKLYQRYAEGDFGLGTAVQMPDGSVIVVASALSVALSDNWIWTTFNDGKETRYTLSPQKISNQVVFFKAVGLNKGLIPDTKMPETVSDLVKLSLISNTKVSLSYGQKAKNQQILDILMAPVFEANKPNNLLGVSIPSFDGTQVLLTSNDLIRMWNASVWVNTANKNETELIGVVTNFTQHVVTKNYAIIDQSWSQKLLYRLGYTAFISLKESYRKAMINQLIGIDIIQSPLYLLQRALTLWFFDNLNKSSDAFVFRTVVSMTEGGDNRNAVVTFIYNDNNVATSWFYQSNTWKIDELPLLFEQKIIEESKVTFQGENSKMKAFSGLTVDLGFTFPEEPYTFTGAIGYNLTPTSWLALDFQLAYTKMYYDYDQRIETHLLIPRIGVRFQFPLAFNSKMYLLPYFGGLLGMPILLSSKYSDQGASYADQLLINRVGVSLMFGWYTGIEYGFIAEIPMAIGTNIGYQVDFFGTIWANDIGIAGQYFMTFYYKVKLEG
jgi:hypothetical protein